MCRALLQQKVSIPKQLASSFLHSVIWHLHILQKRIRILDALLDDILKQTRKALSHFVVCSIFIYLCVCVLFFLQEDSTGSIYKSEILFSPVKEVPLVSFSIDSLDCNEQDIMLTCQANKDNYTIAFEGSTIMDKSTDSHCPNGASNDEKSKWDIWV